MRQKVRLDAAARVGDHDLGVAGLPLQGDGDGPAAGSELHRVGQEIPHHLLEAVGISGDRRR
jgi:hypothetical protein